MSSGGLGSGRLRFDVSHPTPTTGTSKGAATEWTHAGTDPEGSLAAAVRSARDYLLQQQHPDGYWVGELEGDSILESEYVLLLAYLGRENSERAVLAANDIREKQLDDGGWSIYPGGPLELSASVKAYFALKLTGHSPDRQYMQRAREAILAAGGAGRVNSFTRYYLALLGAIPYEHCPAVPPELILIPRWLPLNIYEMSAWSRTILVPLSLLWAHRPDRKLPPELGIGELFGPVAPNGPIAASIERHGQAGGKPTGWDRLFLGLDAFLKLLERFRVRPLRRLAVRRAAHWMIRRFENSDGLGAIFPPIIWSVVALKCLGYPDDAPEVQAALGELEKLSIRSGNTLRLQPCQSPVWDTALSTLALRDANVPRNHPAIRRAVDWLLSKEVRRKGDWAVRKPRQEPSGWFFEFANQFYPDLDDTSMVLMALARCVPATGNTRWTADFLMDNGSPAEADRAAAAVLSGVSENSQSAVDDVDAMTPVLTSIWRGASWVMSLQSRDGGWGAFDADNDRELFTRVPFADHNAMIDPSTSDITARVLEMLGLLNAPREHPAVRRAVAFLWKQQEPDHCWYGRWGVNYIYGTWQVLAGLAAVGVPPGDPRVRRAADWLKSKQQPSGGWGESPRTYDEPRRRGEGPVTASQTAWAVMGLMSAGQAESGAVKAGVRYLLETQCDDGTWDEPWFTGTGFPKVFYLKYHLYRVYFPLMALARYDRLGGELE